MDSLTNLPQGEHSELGVWKARAAGVSRAEGWKREGYIERMQLRSAEGSLESSAEDK